MKIYYIVLNEFYIFKIYFFFNFSEQLIFSSLKFLLKLKSKNPHLLEMLLESFKMLIFFVFYIIKFYLILNFLIIFLLKLILNSNFLNFN